MSICFVVLHIYVSHCCSRSSFREPQVSCRCKENKWLLHLIDINWKISLECFDVLSVSFNCNTSANHKSKQRRLSDLNHKRRKRDVKELILHIAEKEPVKKHPNDCNFTGNSFTISHWLAHSAVYNYHDNNSCVMTSATVQIYNNLLPVGQMRDDCCSQQFSVLLTFRPHPVFATASDLCQDDVVLIRFRRR